MSNERSWILHAQFATQWRNFILSIPKTTQKTLKNNDNKKNMWICKIQIENKIPDMQKHASQLWQVQCKTRIRKSILNVWYTYLVAKPYKT